MRQRIRLTHFYSSIKNVHYLFLQIMFFNNCFFNKYGMNSSSFSDIGSANSETGTGISFVWELGFLQLISAKTRN